jgi:hypothetical protein
VLRERLGDGVSSLEIHGLVLMAFGWFLTGLRVYLIEGRGSLVECFDEVVATCVRATAPGLG